jgi:hypothetical protein
MVSGFGFQNPWPIGQARFELAEMKTILNSQNCEAVVLNFKKYTISETLPLQDPLFCVDPSCLKMVYCDEIT